MATNPQLIAEDRATYEPAPSEQRVLLQSANWDDYARLDALRGDSAVPRLTYLHGALELMTPGLSHESDKKTLARLIEAWADHTGTELTGAGSWTLKDRAKALGAEADECYLIGPLDAEPQRPDIAIEVAKTSGGIDKLKVYRGLGVPEVWFWQRGRLSFRVSIPRSSPSAWRRRARRRRCDCCGPAWVMSAPRRGRPTDRFRHLKAAWGASPCGSERLEPSSAFGSLATTSGRAGP